MPPPGGYGKFNWDRTYAKTFWKPKIMIPTMVAMGAYGIYQGHMQKKQRLTAKFEDVDLYSAMQPFLTAERDRYWLKLLKKNRDLENEVMKDVPGWKTGTWYGEPVYFTLGDKWWDPSFHEVMAHMPRKSQTDEIYWKHHSEYAGPHWYDKYIPDFIGKHIW